MDRSLNDSSEITLTATAIISIRSGGSSRMKKVHTVNIQTKMDIQFSASSFFKTVTSSRCPEPAEIQVDKFRVTICVVKLTFPLPERRPIIGCGRKYTSVHACMPLFSCSSLSNRSSLPPRFALLARLLFTQMFQLSLAFSGSSFSQLNPGVLVLKQKKKKKKKKKKKTSAMSSDPF